MAFLSNFLSTLRRIQNFYLFIAAMTHNQVRYCRVNSLAGFIQWGIQKSLYSWMLQSLADPWIIIMWYALYTDFN